MLILQYNYINYWGWFQLNPQNTYSRNYKVCETSFAEMELLRFITVLKGSIKSNYDTE